MDGADDPEWDQRGDLRARDCVERHATVDDIGIVDANPTP